MYGYGSRGFPAESRSTYLFLGLVFLLFDDRFGVFR
jgi:hypothetical protein